MKSKGKRPVFSPKDVESGWSDDETFEKTIHSGGSGRMKAGVYDDEAFTLPMQSGGRRSGVYPSDGGSGRKKAGVCVTGYTDDEALTFPMQSGG
jgi:hypothetical protein